MFEKAVPRNTSPEPPAVVVPARSPFVTYGVMTLNILVFIAMVLSGVNLVSPSVGAVLAWGADYGPLTLHGQLWRIVTSMFLHFGIIHIGMNMYVLYQIGPFTERLYGHLRYFVLYMLAGVGGSLVSLWIHPNDVGAGASGAIFGVYGGLLAFMFAHRNGIPAASRSAIVRSAAIFLGYNLIYGLQGSIDLSAHIGGLAAGFLLGMLLAVGRQPASVA
jgi:rhomboid protease GluP